MTSILPSNHSVVGRIPMTSQGQYKFGRFGTWWYSVGESIRRKRQNFTEFWWEYELNEQLLEETSGKIEGNRRDNWWNRITDKNQILFRAGNCYFLHRHSVHDKEERVRETRGRKWTCAGNTSTLLRASAEYPPSVGRTTGYDAATTVVVDTDETWCHRQVLSALATAPRTQLTCSVELTPVGWWHRTLRRVRIKQCWSRVGRWKDEKF